MVQTPRFALKINAHLSSVKIPTALSSLSRLLQQVLVESECPLLKKDIFYNRQAGCPSHSNRDKEIMLPGSYLSPLEVLNQQMFSFSFIQAMACKFFKFPTFLDQSF